jgi:hypothetical protein
LRSTILVTADCLCFKNQDLIKGEDIIKGKGRNRKEEWESLAIGFGI